MGTFTKVVLGVVVGGLVLIVGCVAVVGIGLDQASDEMQEAFDEGRAHGVPVLLRRRGCRVQERFLTALGR